MFLLPPECSDGFRNDEIHFLQPSEKRQQKNTICVTHRGLLVPFFWGVCGRFLRKCFSSVVHSRRDRRHKFREKLSRSGRTLRTTYKRHPADAADTHFYFMTVSLPRWSRKTVCIDAQSIRKYGVSADYPVIVFAEKTASFLR